MAVGLRTAVLASLTTLGLTLTLATATTATAQAAIIGGSKAGQAYPFMAYIDKKGAPGHCGGALIAADWIVTAAHCVHLAVPGKSVARIGSLNRLKGGTVVGYKRAVAHPGFKLPDLTKPLKRPLKHDIAVLQLQRKIDLPPVRVADDAGPAGTPTRIIGWGKTCDDPKRPSCDKNLPKHLRQLDTIVVPDRRCTLIAHANEVCVGDRHGRPAGSCNGDSGGPLLRKIAGRWELVGATSRDGDDVTARKDGSGICATNPKGGPGVGIWTDVASYKSWIAETIAEHDPETAAEFLSR
ncbi:S1 family peptidase [Nonomuraea dietziae]|uniref:S1 family peptidase n=1 Tax=Nonomuraea dietziae TaxID=65515 RepID=UPI003422939D